MGYTNRGALDADNNRARQLPCFGITVFALRLARWHIGLDMMDCSWSEAVRLAGYEFARPDSKRLLAFVYTATVSLRVEQSCVRINPSLRVEELEQVLMRAPAWAGKRPEWLKTEWPRRQVQRSSDLEYYGLTASKALLAAGAKIPDGNYVEMLDRFWTLFPEVGLALQQNSGSYEAWNANVTIEMNGNMQWGYGGPLVREGRPLPIADSAFEVFLRNQMRMDIQSRIEADVH